MPVLQADGVLDSNRMATKCVVDAICCLYRVLASLYKRELVYFDVPIGPSDHVSIPPLEVRHRPI
jgi:FAM91 N-terminus